LLRPDNPPMYITNANPHTPYVRERLQVVSNNEANPPESIQRKFIVEKILDKKKIKSKIHFLIKWKGKPDSANSWEPRTNLIKDIPDMVKEYEKNN
jgi:AAA+ superfamily predicted ATPase